MITASLLCLSLNVYYEARGEEIAGQMAVALVTLNRAKEQKKDVCEVVYAPKQFSWTASPSRPHPSGQAWVLAQQIASAATTFADFTYGATHFHAWSVTPDWSLNLKFVARYGNHLFYRR